MQVKVDFNKSSLNSGSGRVEAQILIIMYAGRDMDELDIREVSFDRSPVEDIPDDLFEDRDNAIVDLDKLAEHDESLVKDLMGSIRYK